MRFKRYSRLERNFSQTLNNNINPYYDKRISNGCNIKNPRQISGRFCLKIFTPIINSSSRLNAERDAITGTSPLMLRHEQRWLVLAYRLLILSRSQTTHIFSARVATIARPRPSPFLDGAPCHHRFSPPPAWRGREGAVYGSRLLISTSSAEIRPEFLPLREPDRR